MRIKHKRVMSLLLCGTMLFSLCSQSVAAAAGTQTESSITVSTGNLCEHHPEHDDECGYSEGTTGTACSHEHTDDCYMEVITTAIKAATRKNGAAALQPGQIIFPRQNRKLCLV